MNKCWIERCGAQRIQTSKDEGSERLHRYGFVMGKDEKGFYPIGSFEKCGDVCIYPAQTLNPVEEQTMLAGSVGLVGMWEKTGVLTLRFVKQYDGSDFALAGVDEEPAREAIYLCKLRDMDINTFSSSPQLTEPTSVAVSFGDFFAVERGIREALKTLPEEAKLTGWFERVLRHER